MSKNRLASPMPIKQPKKFESCPPYVNRHHPENSVSQCSQCSQVLPLALNCLPVLPVLSITLNGVQLSPSAPNALNAPNVSQLSPNALKCSHWLSTVSQCSQGSQVLPLALNCLPVLPGSQLLPLALNCLPVLPRLSFTPTGAQLSPNAPDALNYSQWRPLAPKALSSILSCAFQCIQMYFSSFLEALSRQRSA